MGGLEATRLLRDVLYPLPIVALTTHSLSSYQQEAIAAGCQSFLMKPVNWADLYQVVADYLPPSIAGMADTDLDSQYPEAPVELVSRFFSELPATLAKLALAVEIRDRPQVAGLAHQLRGIAGGLGYPQLGVIAGKLEEVARCPQTPAMEPTFAQLQQQAWQALEVAPPSSATF